MSWKIVEITKNSLTELNEYIAKNDIKPSDLIKYNTIYESLKQTTRYNITFWTTKDQLL